MCPLVGWFDWVGWALTPQVDWAELIAGLPPRWAGPDLFAPTLYNVNIDAEILFYSMANVCTYLYSAYFQVNFNPETIFFF